MFGGVFGGRRLDSVRSGRLTSLVRVVDGVTGGVQELPRISILYIGNFRNFDRLQVGRVESLGVVLEVHLAVCTYRLNPGVTPQCSATVLGILLPLEDTPLSKCLQVVEHLPARPLDSRVVGNLAGCRVAEVLQRV